MPDRRHGWHRRRISVRDGATHVHLFPGIRADVGCDPGSGAQFGDRTLLRYLSGDARGQARPSGGAAGGVGLRNERLRAKPGHSKERPSTPDTATDTFDVRAHTSTIPPALATPNPPH